MEGEGEVKRRGEERWMKGVQIKYLKDRGREKKEEGEWYGRGGTRMSTRKQINRWLYIFPWVISSWLTELGLLNRS